MQITEYVVTLPENVSKYKDIDQIKSQTNRDSARLFIPRR